MANIKHSSFQYWALAAILGVAGACANGRVHSVKDPSVDLSKYKTYSWVTQDDVRELALTNPSTEYMTSTARVVRMPEIESKVKGEIDHDLASNGFFQSPPGQADFFVTYYAMKKDKNWVSTWHGLTPGVNDVPLVIYPSYSKSVARTYEDGDLILVFYDAKTHQPAWTGIVDGALKGREVDQQKVASAFDKMVAEFKKG